MVSSIADRSHSIFGSLIDPIARIRLPAILFDESFKAPTINGILIATEGVSLNAAHNLTGSGDISKFFCQIQQSYFVPDDSFVTIKHEGYLSVFNGLGRTSIKTGNPLFFKFGVRSSRNYFKNFDVFGTLLWPHTNLNKSKDLAPS